MSQQEDSLPIHPSSSLMLSAAQHLLAAAHHHADQASKNNIFYILVVCINYLYLLCCRYVHNIIISINLWNRFRYVPIFLFRSSFHLWSDESSSRLCHFSTKRTKISDVAFFLRSSSLSARSSSKFDHSKAILSCRHVNFLRQFSTKSLEEDMMALECGGKFQTFQRSGHFVIFLLSSPSSIFLTTFPPPIT